MSLIANIGSLEKHAFTYILKTYQKHSYNGLQLFLAKMNTSGSKTPTSLIPFQANYDYRSKILNHSIISRASLHSNFTVTQLDL